MLCGTVDLESVIIPMRMTRRVEEHLAASDDEEARTGSRAVQVSAASSEGLADEFILDVVTYTVDRAEYKIATANSIGDASEERAVGKDDDDDGPVHGASAAAAIGAASGSGAGRRSGSHGGKRARSPDALSASEQPVVVPVRGLALQRSTSGHSIQTVAKSRYGRVIKRIIPQS